MAVSPEVGLPDPRDRRQGWWKDDPAYLARYRARTAAEAASAVWDDLAGAYFRGHPTRKALSLIAGLAPIAEMGAGTGD